MKRIVFGALFAAAVASPAWATALPAGTVITGTANGDAAGLLGLDSGFAAVPGSNVTTLAPTDLEYLTSDFAVGIDFFADGLVQFYDNGGLGSIAGSYTLAFDFSGLAEDIVGFTLADVSAISAGSITSTLLGPHGVSITFNDIELAAFTSFTAQISTASAVPEPATLALLAPALALLWGTRRNPHR